MTEYLFRGDRILVDGEIAFDGLREREALIIIGLMQDVDAMGDRVIAAQRRASAAEAEVARLRAENARLMEHCKFIDREVEGGITPADVDALYDITAREYGDNDSEATV